MKYCVPSAVTPAPTRKDEIRWKNPAPPFEGAGGGVGDEDVAK